MNKLRTLTMLIGAAALIAVGAAVGGEAAGLMDGRWRHNLADATAGVAYPGWNAWQSALVGTGLALVAVVLIAAEFTRRPKGVRIMHNVHSTSGGDTRITGKAAMHAARRRIDDIEGIVDVDNTVTRNTMTVTVRVDDRSDLTTVEARVRERLDHEFWINLGLADFAVNVLMTHHPKPPRVR